MNSRTSTKSKVKKQQINKTSTKKKNVSNSTNTTSKKKLSKNVATKSNKVQIKKNANTNSSKKVTSSTQNIRKVKKRNQNVNNIQNRKQIKKEIINNNIDIIDVDGFEEFNEVPKKKVRCEKEYIKNEEENNKVSTFTVLLVTFIIGIIIACLYLMFTLEYFNLQNILVEGNTKYTSEKIIQNCKLNVGDNVFKQLFNKEYNKSELPYVSKLKYIYSFPNTIKIEIEERYPEYIAKDKNTGKYYMIDNQGYLLEECTLEQKNEELLIEGLAFEENVEFGKKIDEVYIKKIDRYQEIKQLIEKAEISTNITKVSFDASLTIITIDDKLNVVFSNDSNLGYKVSFLKGIINQNNGILEGTIDMSMENPVYSKYD